MAATTVVDDRAFERLYRRYARDVYRFSLALLRNPSEAEDVTQTTFMNAYRALQAGEQPRRPHSWLLTIAHNTARSRVRRAMRRPREVPLDDVMTQLAVPEHERTNIRELLRALRRLPFNQRAAITMRELEGKTYPEIAETLGVTVPAVEALLARARRTLRMHAAAIRGLSLVWLPRSLRRLFESGEATTGGTIGAGFLAKAAALVVAAGVVAGGVGFSSGEASTPAPSSASEAFWPRAAAVVAAPRWTPRKAPSASKGTAPTTRAAGSTAVIHRIGPLPVPDPGTTREPAAPRRAPEAVHDAASSAAPAPAPAPAPATRPVRAAVGAARQPVHSTVDVAKDAAKGTVATVVQTVPELPPLPPSPPVQPPPPPIPVPALPAPQPPPTLPQLPGLP
jgi:RNA polymerase sigma factor (sigma-70 family)